MLLQDGWEIGRAIAPYGLAGGRWTYAETVARLRRFRADRPVLRAFLSEVEPGLRATLLNDEEILARLAQGVVLGRLYLVRPRPWLEWRLPPEKDSGADAGDEPAQSPESSQSSAAQEQTRQPAEEDAAEQEPAEACDEEAQAQALKEAAESGTPFCEECNKGSKP